MKKQVIEGFLSMGLESNVFCVEKPVSVIVNQGVKALRNKGYNDAALNRALSRINEIMNYIELENADQVTVIIGVKETLRKLKEQGFRIGILTRSCPDYTIKALKKTGLLEFVDSIACRDGRAIPKPDGGQMFHLADMLKVKLDEILFLGDHLLDLETARNANVKFIGVLTGFSDKETLRKAGCENILRNISELLGNLNKRQIISSI